MEEAKEEDHGQAKSYEGQFIIRTLSSSLSSVAGAASTTQEDVFKRPLAFKTPIPSNAMKMSTPNGLLDSGICGSPQDLSPIERWNESSSQRDVSSFEASLLPSTSPTPMDYILASPEVQESSGIRTLMLDNTACCSLDDFRSPSSLFWGLSEDASISKASSSGYYSLPSSSSVYFSLDTSPCCSSVLPESLQQPERKDILKKLYRGGNYHHILSLILGYLSPKDLAHSRLVSKTWNRLVSEDKPSRDRLAAFRLDKIHSENLDVEEKRRLYRTNGKRSAFFDLSNESPLPPSPTKEQPFTNLSNFDKFLKERNNCAPGETLHRCPKCQSPSHATRRAAKCTQCKLDFCLVCYMDRTTSFHDTMCRSAVQRIASPTKVVSKSSKRRLRRLASLKM